MRKIIFLLIIILSLPSILCAADPIIGTWKLNISKSKFPPNQPAPKEQVETYRELADGQIELTYQSTEKDGSSMLLVGTYPIQGGVAVGKVEALKGSFIHTRISQDEWYETILRDGKQIMTIYKKISNDGKTMRQTVRRQDNEGQTVEVLLIYERQ